MQEFIELANRMADKSGEIIRQYYRQPFEIQQKGDRSPVTVADREVEKALRDMLTQERPNDTILGEEYGIIKGNSGLTWVIDPIDGTKSFMIGRPTFGTLIALCDGNTPILGVIDQPITKERWLGADGHKTTLNGAAIKTRPCTNIDDAVIGATTPMMFDDVADYGRAYHMFEQGTSRMVWGGDCYMYGLLAGGHVDVVFEQNLKPHDFAALVPIVKGAGGHISDWRGDELTLNATGKVIAVGDPVLWPNIERMIRKSPF